MPVFVFENQGYGTFPLRKRTTSGWRASTRTERCCLSTCDRNRGTVAPVMGTVGQSTVSQGESLRCGKEAPSMFHCSSNSEKLYGALIYGTYLWNLEKKAFPIFSQLFFCEALVIHITVARDGCTVVRCLCGTRIELQTSTNCSVDADAIGCVLRNGCGGLSGCRK